ncbi:MAG: beta-ketoacyl synthase chain length factor [Candidatus Cryptobacteroides sp.]
MDFFLNPVPCDNLGCNVVEADYRQFLSPMAARRMGPVLKRAIAVTVSSLEQSGIGMPDAVVCGTGLGCLDNTEKFLKSMIDNGEMCLQPTFFINSTHNTIASQIASYLKCNGYNSTYSHLGISFGSALLDVLMQMESGIIKNAVVGGYDEMTPTFRNLFAKTGYFNSPIGECAVSVVLSNTKTEKTKCSLEDVDIMRSNSLERVEDRLRSFLNKNGAEPCDVDCIMTGRNGDSRYDGGYDALVNGVFGPDMFQCRYKHIFGESFTAPAYGFVTSVEMLSEGFVPQPYIYSGERKAADLGTILLIDSFKSLDWSFALLRK